MKNEEMQNAECRMKNAECRMKAATPGSGRRELLENFICGGILS
ncbi:MAG: hypothetical protein ABSG78_12540 [Verrucomicrobiota bacterium]|jgi:hypothetical protein